MPAFASMTVSMNSKSSGVIVIPAQAGIQQVCQAASRPSERFKLTHYLESRILQIDSLSTPSLSVGRIQLIVERLLHQFDVGLVSVRVNVGVRFSCLELGVLFAKIKEFAV